VGGAIDFALGLWTWHWASAGSVADFLLNANIAICELAHIGVIDTEDLHLFCGTERKTGNDVHDPEDDSLDGIDKTLLKKKTKKKRRGTYRHDERVGKSRDEIRELMGKLDVMLVQPTTGNDGDPVESSDAGPREEAGEEFSDNTDNSIRNEDLNLSEQQESLEKKNAYIKGIIITKEEL
jgi:hypothetical protein